MSSDLLQLLHLISLEICVRQIELFQHTLVGGAPWPRTGSAGPFWCVAHDFSILDVSAKKNVI